MESGSAGDEGEVGQAWQEFAVHAKLYRQSHQDKGRTLGSIQHWLCHFSDTTGALAMYASDVYQFHDTEGLKTFSFQSMLYRPPTINYHSVFYLIGLLPIS